MLQLNKIRPIVARSVAIRSSSHPVLSARNEVPLAIRGGHLVEVISFHSPSSLIRPLSTTSSKWMCDDGAKNEDSNSKKILNEQNFKVPSFGGIFVMTCPFNVQVRPTGALDYPNLDQAFFKLYGQKNVHKSDTKIDVTQEGSKLCLEATTSKKELNSCIEALVEVPIVHSVDVVAEESASIEVHDFMESDFCNLKSTSGDISITKVKTKNLNVETESGDVFCHGHVQGNVRIHTDSGNVVGDKRFMGTSLDINTNTGDIRVASCYAEHSKFSTNRGSMNLRNLHNESYVAVYEQGDVKIHGIDGATNVFLKKGDLDVQVSNVRAESRLHVEEGDIHLRLSDAHPLKISIEANDVIPDTKFQSHGKLEKSSEKNVVHYFAALQPDQFSPSLVVIAENGNVILESQDWAASTMFKLRNTHSSANSAKIEMATSAAPKKI